MNYGIIGELFRYDTPLGTLSLKHLEVAKYLKY